MPTDEPTKQRIHGVAPEIVGTILEVRHLRKDRFHGWFPHRSLIDAQRVWRAVEEQFFDRYRLFLRVCFDYRAHHQAALALARELKRELGESIYVECEELQEVLADGSTIDCRLRLGLPQAGDEQ